MRYLLWIRLSRALRVTEFFEKLEKDIRINYLFTRIVKLLVVELYCTHAAACIFYYLATTMPASQEGYTWIGSLKMGDYSYSHFRDIDLWKRYFTSLYFAIVTMATVGKICIHVHTRIYYFSKYDNLYSKCMPPHNGFCGVHLNRGHGKFLMAFLLFQCVNYCKRLFTYLES